MTATTRNYPAVESIDGSALIRLAETAAGDVFVMYEGPKGGASFERDPFFDTLEDALTDVEVLDDSDYVGEGE